MVGPILKSVSIQKTFKRNCITRTRVTISNQGHSQTVYSILQSSNFIFIIVHSSFLQCVVLVIHYYSRHQDPKWETLRRLVAANIPVLFVNSEHACAFLSTCVQFCARTRQSKTKERRICYHWRFKVSVDLRLAVCTTSFNSAYCSVICIVISMVH